ncbi:MAG: hypothetical protein JW702_11470 [Clostridiales bacterium]|nr:hypothetical protein [Clostridiales bacterium]
MELPSGKPDQKDDRDEYMSLENCDVTVEDIINDIKNIMENHENPSIKINDLINGVEEIIEKKAVVDKEKIKNLILRHPFFKNPNHYYIRLITIMKYLKKKGIDMAIRDIDLVVDEIIQQLPGVKKIGQDRYALKK